MRVLLMIPTLGPGGAERVMTSLAEGLVRNGHEVFLLTLSGRDTDFYAVPAGVSRIALAAMGNSRHLGDALLANLRRILAVRRAIVAVKPDALLSFMTSMNVLTVLASVGLCVRVVASERVDPASYSSGRVWNQLRLCTYRHLDALVVQTADAQRWFRERLPRLHIARIVNPLAVQSATPADTIPVPKPFVLAAGRLVHQKGFDLLIRAFGTVARDVPAMRLAIAGEGPDEASLRALAAELGLSARVLFLGRVSALPALMREATAFILSSRFEGFPNVLLEALDQGVPTIATDCPGGSREILRDGTCGLLVPCENVTALAEAIRRLIGDTALQQELSRAGRTVAAEYRIERIIPEWERALGRPGALH